MSDAEHLPGLRVHSATTPRCDCRNIFLTFISRFGCPHAAEAATTNGAGYPWNPNGSQADIAGVCNPAGTVFGLMPHPEDHVIPQQHPRVHRGERGLLGLPLFVNGVRYAAQVG